jgi:hypothetical protein
LRGRRRAANIDGMGGFARFRLAAASLLAAVLLLGCTTEQPTQIVVSVNTDLALGTQIDALHLVIRRKNERGEFVTVKELQKALSRADDLPLTLGLTRAENGSNTVQVTAEAFFGGDTMPVIRRVAVAHFVTGRVLSLPVNLVAACLDSFLTCEGGAPVDDIKITCGDQGECEPAEHKTLDGWHGPPAFQPGQGLTDAGTLDAGEPEPDAGVDASIGDGDRVVQLALGARHSCALWASGAVQCWGANDLGQLSWELDAFCPDEEDDSIRCSFPRQLLIPDAISLTAGDDFTCAALSNGKTVCWGSDEDGALGDGQPIPDDAGNLPPAQIGEVVSVDGVEDAQFVEAGGTSVCANGGAMGQRCWGGNHGQQLTVSEEPYSFPSATKSDRPTTDATLTLGDAFGCAIASGAVVCWGDDQLGQGGEDEPVPGIQEVPITGNAKLVAAGGQHACALLNTGEVRCWGRNDLNQVGVSTMNQTRCVEGSLMYACAKTAVAVNGEPRARALALGGLFSCLITEDASAEAKCWGDNRNGAIDSASTAINVTRPVTVPGMTNVRLLAAGKKHACAVNTSNELWCWGSNEAGQLGPNASLGNDRDAQPPSKIELPAPR